jgi:hypothetical protein
MIKVAAEQADKGERKRKEMMVVVHCRRLHAS